MKPRTTPGYSHGLDAVADFVLVGSSVEAVPGVEHVVQVSHFLLTDRRRRASGTAQRWTHWAEHKGLQRHLIPDTDLLLVLHLTHSGKLEEALIVKEVLDAQVVAVPVETDTRGQR